METIKRNRDILSGSCELEELYRFENFPIHMDTSDENEKSDLYADLVFQIDRSSGMITLGEVIPNAILYQNAHYNNIAKSWMEHHEAFAKFINKFKPSNVFEIGGGTGLLSCCYHNIDCKVPWTILEPVPNPVHGCRAKYITGFFDEKYKIPDGYAVVHAHTLEHFYRPLEFMQAIGNAMQIGSWMFMSVPNMKEMFQRNYTNVMNFEHTYYCAEPYISDLLTRSGYELIEYKLFKDDHSVFEVVY